MYFKTFLKDYQYFFTNPAILLNNKSSFVVSIWYIFHSVWLSLVIALVLGGLSGAASFYAGYDTEANNKVVEFVAQNGIWRILFYTSILAPVTEETSFRLIQSTSKYIFSLGLSLLILFTFSVLGWGYPFVTILLIGGSIITGVLLSNDTTTTLFLTKYFRLLLLATTFLFALPHLMNYNNLEGFWYLAPLLISAQFFSGTFYSLMRVKYGLSYGIITHALYNAIIIVFVMFVGPVGY